LLNHEPRTSSVIATSDVRVLFLRKDSFEDLLGPLSVFIDDASKKRIFAAKQLSKTTSDIDESPLKMAGLVSSDAVGPLLLGYFGKNVTAKKPNVCVRSFLVSEVDALNLSGAVIISIEAAQLVSKAALSSVFVPKLVSVLRDVNALHLVFAAAVVSDLSYMIKAMEGAGSGTASTKCSMDILVYVSACLVAALECMHGAGIVYRAIQPESVCVDLQGRIMLMDYKVCKIGGVGTRSFTICGASDYLAPEQISQRGHGAPVDLWALGVLMFELATDSLPFSANSEVATYAKISSFGSKAFPELPFPGDVPMEVKSIINRLLMPTPEARLGSGHDGLLALKKHRIFNSIDWATLDRRPSPLSALCALEYEEIVKEGVEASILESFDREIDESNHDWLLDINYTC